MTQTISELGLALIKNYEGCRLRAYRDTGGVLSVGTGHTAGVYAGQVITQAEADAYLREDLATAEAAVHRLVRVRLTQGAYDALVSFCFNCGAGNLRASTLLKLVNAGLMQAAAAEFPKWCNVAGCPSDGLLRRRQSEARLFMTPDIQPEA